jgi:lysophospholipase L1-like esterase
MSAIKTCLCAAMILVAAMLLPAALSHIFGKGGLKSDYIHPNAAGYRLLAEALVELLKKSGALLS